MLSSVSIAIFHHLNLSRSQWAQSSVNFLISQEAMAAINAWEEEKVSDN